MKRLSQLLATTVVRPHFAACHRLARPTSAPAGVLSKREMSLKYGDSAVSLDRLDLGFGLMFPGEPESCWKGYPDRSGSAKRRRVGCRERCAYPGKQEAWPVDRLTNQAGPRAFWGKRPRRCKHRSHPARRSMSMDLNKASRAALTRRAAPLSLSAMATASRSSKVTPGLR